VLAAAERWVLARAAPTSAQPSRENDNRIEIEAAQHNLVDAVKAWRASRRK
jgi:hypothetical protein